MHTDTTTQTITLPLPAATWTTSNDRLHWRERARRTKIIRTLARVIARTELLPVPTPATITVQVHRPRRTRADAQNASPTLKAACDGLVDAGILPDDDDQHIAAVTYTAGEPTGLARQYALTITLTGPVHLPPLPDPDPTEDTPS